MNSVGTIKRVTEKNKEKPFQKRNLLKRIKLAS